MKIACTGDVHLDASFKHLPLAAARARRQAIRESFRAALDRAQEEGADALLIAGDLYEHDRVTTDTGNFLRDAFARVAPMRVFVAPGNHDWLGPQGLYRLVDWPENVHLFEEPRLQPVKLSDRLTLWGGAHLAPAGTPGFLKDFRATGDGVHLALFHGSEQGEFRFQEEGKELHAPFSDAEVRAAGLHHAFVGHFHTPIDGPAHTYPGSVEPLTFGETRLGGVVLADVSSDGTIQRERVIVTQTRVWDEQVDVTSATHLDEIVERVRVELTGKSGLARVTLCGSLDPHVDLRLGDIERAVDGLDVLVVRMDGLHPAYDLEAISQEQTVRGQFLRDLQAAPLDDDLKQRAIVTGLRALEGRADLEVIS